MKKFKQYIVEAPDGKSDAPTAMDNTRERQKREKDALRIRQQRELDRAREQDFRKKEQQRKAEQSKKEAERRLAAQEDTQYEEYDEVLEYLEDGTLSLVKVYKKAVPGQ